MVLRPLTVSKVRNHCSEIKILNCVFIVPHETKKIIGYIFRFLKQKESQKTLSLHSSLCTSQNVSPEGQVILWRVVGWGSRLYRKGKPAKVGQEHILGAELHVQKVPLTHF